MFSMDNNMLNEVQSIIEHEIEIVDLIKKCKNAKVD